MPSRVDEEEIAISIQVKRKTWCCCENADRGSNIRKVAGASRPAPTSLLAVTLLQSYIARPCLRGLHARCQLSLCRPSGHVCSA